MATEQDRVNSPTIGALVLAGAIVSLVIVLLLHVVYINMHDHEWDEKIGSKLNAEANKMKATQNEELRKDVRWIDQSKKIVGVPIEQSKEMVLKEVTQ
jgi:uncharacterized membrane protein